MEAGGSLYPGGEWRQSQMRELKRGATGLVGTAPGPSGTRGRPAAGAAVCGYGRGEAYGGGGADGLFREAGQGPHLSDDPLGVGPFSF